MHVRNRPDGNRDVNGVPSLRSETVGQGRVTIYRDGKKEGGSWKRVNLSAPLQFVDKSGEEISLSPRQDLAHPVRLDRFLPCSRDRELTLLMRPQLDRSA
jgi:hypothetical protein